LVVDIFDGREKKTLFTNQYQLRKKNKKKKFTHKMILRLEMFLGYFLHILFILVKDRITRKFKHIFFS
jgi:hypothetical protein